MFEDITLVMSLPREVARQLDAAFGYLELSMPEEAWEELDLIAYKYQEELPVELGRVDIRMRQGRWHDALAMAERICSKHPSEAAGFISRSFCLHCLGRTNDALDKLLESPASAHQVPTYHYNLACYQCQLGDIEEARSRLIKAVGMDRSYIEFARQDPDLKPIWPEIDTLAARVGRYKT